jgi:RNA polymerase sigma-70 factor (ECF subfamily)
MLPAQCREVYQLSRLEQMPYKEIARLKNISVKTVENHISYAIKRIRPALKEFFPFLVALKIFF